MKRVNRMSRRLGEICDQHELSERKGAGSDARVVVQGHFFKFFFHFLILCRKEKSYQRSCLHRGSFGISRNRLEFSNNSWLGKRLNAQILGFQEIKWSFFVEICPASLPLAHERSHKTSQPALQNFVNQTICLARVQQRKFLSHQNREFFNFCSWILPYHKHFSLVVSILVSFSLHFHFFTA